MQGILEFISVLFYKEDRDHGKGNHGDVLTAHGGIKGIRSVILRLGAAIATGNEVKEVNDVKKSKFLTNLDTISLGVYVLHATSSLPFTS